MTLTCASHDHGDYATVIASISLSRSSDFYSATSVTICVLVYNKTLKAFVIVIKNDPQKGETYDDCLKMYDNVNDK